MAVIPFRHAKAQIADRYVTWEQFDALRRALDECRRDIEIQFKRTAEIQAELDHIRLAWQKSAGKRRRNT